jgi:predicted lysophospholipase L1 biosynthesis ABC-type transport system permease subunit
MNGLRIAVRQTVQKPGFALTVVMTLGLTVGATTAVFSVVNGVLLRALPFQSPERLVWVASVRPDNPSAPFTLSMGATQAEARRMVLGQAARLGVAGAAAGLVLVFTARALVSGLVPEVSIHPAVAAAAAAVLLGVVLLAARIEPTRALRAE